MNGTQTSRASAADSTSREAPTPGAGHPDHALSAAGATSRPDIRDKTRPKRDHQRSRIAGIRDGACQAVAQGIGEQYFSAFALLLHASPFHLGLLSALPQLVGTWAQLFAASRATARRSRKSLILTGAWAQTVWWVPLCIVPLTLTDHAAPALIGLAVVYAALGHLTVPPWNSLITDAVGPNLRGLYFGQRARIMALANFVALGLGGALLQATHGRSVEWLGFALVFGLAAIARGFSAHVLGTLSDIPRPDRRDARPSAWTLLTRSGSSNFRRFLAFSALMHAATLLAGPYFVVYLLKHLHFTYFEYGAWLAAQTVGQFATLKAWGRLGDRYGHTTVLQVTGFLVPVLPVLYLFGTSVPYLIGVNFLAGAVWAGLSLAMGTYVFETVGAEDKLQAVAVMSIANAAGWFSGAMVGGWLTELLPNRLLMAGMEVALASNLPLLFLLSGCLRLIVSGSFLPQLHEARAVEHPRLRAVLAELPLVQPLHRAWSRVRRKAEPPRGS